MKGAAPWREALLELLYPRDVRCACCDKEALTRGGLCGACAARFHPALPRETPAGLDGFHAAWVYEEPLRGMMHRFKFQNASHLADFFSAYMQPSAHWSVTGLVPVPLHPAREKARGYNQSLLLAERIAARTGMALKGDILLRIRDTQTQTELDAAARARNLRDAFALQKSCAGERLLLIDDICTTGSTLCECARTLRMGGAAAVCGLTAASARLL